ncbi:MAG: hypothetical protein IJ419_09535 [Agathobacter sp.]|nr:hypothetical protein [Agathobacter sp.]
MRQLSDEEKEFLKLYQQCVNELQTGGHEATQKMLEYWGVAQPVHDSEIYKRIQLMLLQEQYAKDPWGEIAKRDDESLRYRISVYRQDFKAFTEQLIAEHQKSRVAPESLQSDIKTYNGLLSKMNIDSALHFADPNSGTVERISVNSVGYGVKPPEIYHAGYDDWEGYRLEDKTLQEYSQNTEGYFKNVARSAILNNIPLIHITPEQISNIVITQKKQTQPESIETVKAEKGSPLSAFLSKFAERSNESKNEHKNTKHKHDSADFGQLKKGMHITIPKDTTNIIDGQKLPEMTVEVLDVWQQGGQSVIATTAGILTTRDMSIDIHDVLQERIAQMTYEIEHAEEIRQREEELKARCEYENHWFSNIQSAMPALPRDDRLDTSDISYFGYTAESFHIAASERARDYEEGMKVYQDKAHVYAKELVQKCLDNNVRMVYVPPHWGNFHYYGPTPTEHEAPDLSHGRIPDKWVDQVFLPSGCIDAMTGSEFDYYAGKMSDIWDTIVVGEKPNQNFGIVGQTVDGEIIMATSIDIREAIREMTQGVEIEIEGEETPEFEEDHHGHGE